MDKKEDKVSFKGKYYYALGKRKTAAAKVRVYQKGKGRILINDRDLVDFFPTQTLQTIVKEALSKVSGANEYDVSIMVSGGGLKGQAEAIRLGIAKALVDIDKDVRPVLKKSGLLTRDSRKKERKKPGLKKARRAPQWKKR